MEKKEIRLLRADEIECRVGIVNPKGCSLLLYKDARADMRILDETFGVLGWQRFHQSIDGELFCAVKIWDEDKKQWICKEDVGTTSYTEKEKGRASDSFKRASVVVGVGRELYTAPFIWISSEKTRIEKEDGKLKVKDGFTVHHIAYDENRAISELIIANQDGNIVFEKKAKKKRTKAENTYMDELTRELIRTGVSLDTVLARYNVSSLDEMTSEDFNKAMRSLQKTKDKAA